MSAAVRGLHPVCMNTSSYSTLSAAVPGASLPHRPAPKNTIVSRTPVPAKPLAPSPGWESWPRNTAVMYESTGRPWAMLRGVLFMDISKGVHVSHGDLPAFPPTGKASIELRVSWPGYRHLERTYHIAIIAHGRPITRLQLAQEVVRCYERFFSHARQGHYAGGHENGSWQITSDFLSQSQSRMVLRSISNTHGNQSVFQAEVDVVTWA
ncbi:hypothetical protein OH77DRAFT_1520985 [Trametes cingulata]|nr:hypothetical protein OH77DRAFT_1520985 [Trametes cingulata]